MAILFTNTLSFHSNPNIQCSTTSNSKLGVTNYNPNSITFPINQPLIACTIAKNKPPSPKPSNLIEKLLSIHQKNPKFLTKNAAKLILGSLILMGSFGIRPVKALPVKSDVNLEENKETQENKKDDEDGDEFMRYQMYMKLLEQEPRNVEALKAVVNEKMKKGNTKEAVKYVESLIKIEPNQVEWRLLQALCYEMMGNLTKATRLFNEILKRKPLLLRALHGLAMVMHKNREGDAVFDMLNNALELALRERRVTEERNIKILIAQMHLIKGNLDEALEKYRKLIDEDPRDFRPYLCQGIIYSLQDKKEAADEQFEIYKNLVPEEFPQRGFLEDVVLAAKTESREQLEKEFKAEFSPKQ